MLLLEFMLEDNRGVGDFLGKVKVIQRIAAFTKGYIQPYVIGFLIGSFRKVSELRFL